MRQPRRILLHLKPVSQPDQPSAARGQELVEPLDGVDRLCERRDDADTARLGGFARVRLGRVAQHHHRLRVAGAGDLETIDDPIVEREVETERARQLAAGAGGSREHRGQEEAVPFQPDLRLQLHGIAGARRPAGHEEHFPARLADPRIEAPDLIRLVRRHVEPPVRRAGNGAPEAVDVGLRQIGLGVFRGNAELPLGQRAERAAKVRDHAVDVNPEPEHLVRGGNGGREWPPPPRRACRWREG